MAPKLPCRAHRPSQPPLERPLPPLPACPSEGGQEQCSLCRARLLGAVFSTLTPSRLITRSQGLTVLTASFRAPGRCKESWWMEGNGKGSARHLPGAPCLQPAHEGKASIFADARVTDLEPQENQPKS